MQTFIYMKTQTHFLHIDAETEAEAYAIAETTDVYADNVFSTELGEWELTDGEV
jgi:hypothetical protein